MFGAVSVWGQRSLTLHGRVIYLSETGAGRPRAGTEETNVDEVQTPQTGPVILIVEDDFLIAADVEASLKSAGFNVCGIAASADDAISLAKAHNPALVIMDIRLVGKRDGVDAALELQRDLGLRCIFASAHADDDTRRRAEPAHPLGWMAKPYATSSLIQLIKSSLILLRSS